VVCSENQMFSTNKLLIQNELYNAKPSGTYSYRCAIEKQFRNLLAGFEEKRLETSV
jgi:hypothetical protein